MSTGAIIALALGMVALGILIGGFLGMWISQRKIKKQLEENPPISEKQIRAMFMQMGRKPSEAQIKAVMRSMKQAK
ncbi:YneF family protein [Mycoplasma sp. 128]|uniref:YneF family protein n=1 Tax=Mycoplasma sp. 3341 TaxID=3447506 RepID=UPI003F65B4FE